MNTFTKLIVGLLLIALCSITAHTQSVWPKEIAMENGGRLILYPLQAETLTENQLTARGAVAVRHVAEGEPVFGAIWLTARLTTSKGPHEGTLEGIRITNVRFPPANEESPESDLEPLIRRAFASQRLTISLDELNASLDAYRTNSQAEFNNAAPEIIYTQQPTTLVRIDGQPFVQYDEDLGVDRVENTPFVLVRDPDNGQYYLYANRYWYQSAAILLGWMPVDKLPRAIRKVNRKLSKQENQDEEQPALPPAIVVRTHPAELIQSGGPPQVVPIENTKLLFVSNTQDQIFLDINTQQYYVVLAGRWYTSSRLEGPWDYVYAERLPADFARIPESSEKGEVLTYVPGTNAAREATMDAQTPQSARVDRRRAVCQVSYDGEPQFEPIGGTHLFLAVNASGTVLWTGNRYYCVDNGVWFEADRATGPWAVATERPGEVDRIPPRSPAYPVRYVYIYEVTPDFVYMGYTAGYLGCYVFGPTVVYGTGYVYPAWFGRVYYPRPVTWGFGIHYDPWAGWSFGFNTSWFYVFDPWYRPWSWWGPSLYRPAYRPHYRPGYRPSYGPRDRRAPTASTYDYPNRPVLSNRTVLRGSATPNLYRNRGDVATSRGGGYTAPDRPQSPRTSTRSSDLFKRGQTEKTGITTYRDRSRTKPSTETQERKSTNPRSSREINPANRATTRPNMPTPQRRIESRSAKPAPRSKSRGPQ